jgi:hypothetical protein
MRSRAEREALIESRWLFGFLGDQACFNGFSLRGRLHNVFDRVAAAFESAIHFSQHSQTQGTCGFSWDKARRDFVIIAQRFNARKRFGKR